MRVVIDTGVLVSSLLRKESIPGAVVGALKGAQFSAIYSTEMLMELIDVLGRAKFRVKYGIRPKDITGMVNLLRLRGDLVMPTEHVFACRDPKDDKFLAVALAGQADYIVSGDADLLVLSPFKGIPVLRPAEFLARLSM